MANGLPAPSAGFPQGAVKLMYAGTAVSTVPLIIALAHLGGIPSIRDIKAHRLRWDGHSLTAAQLSQLRPLIITLTIVFGLVVPALWLWMARANGRGLNWARILSMVLFGLATLQLTSVFGTPVSHAGVGGMLLRVIPPVLAWLVGLAVVWLLWRPAYSAFFKPQGFTQTGYRAQPSSRIGSASSRWPRQL